jgi:hypothetical protein
MKELKDLVKAIKNNIYNIDSNVIIDRSQDEMPVIPLQYISEELELASDLLKTTEKETIKPYEDLDTDDLFHLAGEYSNYIIEFDYQNSGTPVSIYEFYEYEYQEILEEQDK